MFKNFIITIILGWSFLGFSQTPLTDPYQPPQTVADQIAVRMLPGFHANSNDGNYVNGEFFRAKIGHPLADNIPPPVVHNPSSGENYVYSRTYLAPVTESNPYAPQIQSIQYFDGLGRPKQSVAIKASPTGKDLVTPIVYDGFGRQHLDYLPIPQSGTTNGQIYPQTPQTNPNSPIPFPVPDTGNFYQGEKIYSEKKLEYSPLDRITQQIQVGTAWQNKPVNFGYETNGVNEVYKFITTTTWPNDATNSTLTKGIYGANQLALQKHRNR